MKSKSNLSLTNILSSTFQIRHSLKHRSRYPLLFFTILLVALLPLAYFSTKRPQSAEAGWFDYSWAYRQTITITNNSSQESNAYISFDDTDVLNTSDSDKFQSDCGDIRFTKQNGELLPYFINSGCGTSATDIDVFFDSFPAGAQVIYMYYGNPSASDGFEASGFSTEASNYTINSVGSEENAPGPVAWWKFDEGVDNTCGGGQDACDSGPHANHLSANNITWHSEDYCVTGKCLEFDGSSSSLSVADTNNSLDLSGSFTISTWIKFTDITSSASYYLIEKGAPAGAANYYLWYNNNAISPNNTLVCGFHNGSSFQDHDVSWTPELNRWYLVSCVFDDTNNSIVIYINGSALLSEAETTSPATDNGALHLGENRNSNTFFDGFMDEVKIYPYARSETQIKADYLKGSAKIGSSAVLGTKNLYFLSDGLVGYWKMDEASWNGTSGEVLDASGNENHGTAIGTSGTSSGSNDSTTLNDTSKSWVTDAFANGTIYITGGTGSGQARTITSNTNTQVTVSQPWTTIPDSTSTYRITPNTTAGKFGNAGYFGGPTSSDQLWGTRIHFSPVTMGGETGSALTLSAWIYPTGSSPGLSTIIRNGQLGDNNYGFYLTELSGGEFKFSLQYYDGTAFRAITSTERVVPINQWSFATAVLIQGQKVKFYLNGSLIETLDWIGNNSVTNASTLAIGGTSAAAQQYFVGSIDEVRIYNRALSAAEVRALYEWAPGPVAYYNFDEASGTSTLFDRSGNGHTGTISGMSQSAWTQGKFGSALYFDGTDDEVNIGDITELNSAHAFTVTAWVKHDDNTRSDRIFHKYQDGDHDISIAPYYLTYPRIFIEVGNGSNSYAYWNSSSLTSGTWYHLAAVFDGSGTSNSERIKLFINGVQKTLTFSGTIPSTTADLSGYSALISPVNAAGGNDPFGGSLDEIKIYNYARTQKQIVEDMNAGHPAPGSPVGSQRLYWKFDEGYGTKAYDSSGQGNNGTLTCSGTGCTIPSWTNSGKFNKALYFNPDVNSKRPFVTTSPINLSSTTGEKMTWTMWIKPEASQVDEGWLIRNGVSTDENYGIYLGNPSGGYYRVYFSGYDTNFRTIYTTNYIVPAQEWSHLAVVFSQGEWMKVYINGIFKEQVNWYAGNTVQATSSFNVGAHSGASQNYNGYIDEVKVYDGELTEDEIKLDYNQGKAIVMGAFSTDSSGNPTWSSSREYCVPGDTAYCAPPVAEWKFDEKTGTAAYDTSGNGKTATWNGTLGNQWTTGRAGSAGNFNGTDNYLTAATPFTGSGSFSIFAWIKLSATGARREIIDWGASASNQALYFFVNSSNKIQFDLEGAAGPSSSATATDGNWHHVGVVNNSGTVQIYVDGQASGSSANMSPNISSGTAYIGRHRTLNQNHFPGQIDHIKIYDYARTPAQIAWDYNRGKPVAWWKFDECQGTTAHDSGPFANHGTINPGTAGNTSAGTCNSGTSTEMWNNGTTGKFSSALDFDGQDDSVDITTFTGFPRSEISVSAWIKLDTHQDWNRILHHDWVVSNGGYLFFTDALGYLNFGIYSSGQYNAVATGLSTGTWHHVVGTYDGTTVKAYIDGKLGTTATVSQTLDTDGGYDIGGGTSNDEFDGLIDEVKIWNYALNADQVKKEFNAGSAIHFE